MSENSESVELWSKVPVLEWAADQASDQLDGLNWVDSELDAAADSFQLSLQDKKRLYHHRPYSYFLPKAMYNAARAAQRNGEPTVLEAMTLLYARIEWLTAARGYFWSPLSPIPKLLAIMSEAFGVGPEIHRNRKEALSRLVARLPTWHKYSGTAKSAKQLIEDTVGDKLGVQVAHINENGETPVYPPIEAEMFACRDHKWWSRRSKEKSKMKMRISNGLVLFQQSEENIYPLVREDVLVGWHMGKEFPTNFLRLLPIWISIRLVLLSGDKK